ncbi:MAG TPA: hypothetical protein VKT32_04835 [Chthonomonadaceae bacterium]|nr:hypothetical protein [Chthonomonadaceae bacterium]
METAQVERQIDVVVAAVQQSPKYRAVSPDLIRRIGMRELAARRSVKEAIKETKNTLHQLAGAYLDRRVHYDRWLEGLSTAASDPEAFRQTCREIMAAHASTRERLPLLETFYTTTLAGLGPIASVLDVACGFNPLSIPWMPLAHGAAYTAIDIYSDLATFLNSYFPLAGVSGQALVGDIGAAPPTTPVTLAMALKALPLLEQMDRQAGLNLLRALQADYLLVSFPTASLGGNNRGMIAHYEARFRDLVRSEPWQIERFAFATELCFLVNKSQGCTKGASVLHPLPIADALPLPFREGGRGQTP